MKDQVPFELQLDVFKNWLLTLNDIELWAAAKVLRDILKSQEKRDQNLSDPQNFAEFMRKKFNG